MTLWSYEAADIVDCDDNEQEAKKEEEGRIWRKRRIKGKKKDTRNKDMGENGKGFRNDDDEKMTK